MSATLITKAFRLMTIIDLSSITKGEIEISPITAIEKNPEREVEEIIYGDDENPAHRLVLSNKGNIVIRGNLEKWMLSTYSAQTRTAGLFEIDHYYLLRFLQINQISGGDAIMVYNRWIGQLQDDGQISLESGALNGQELTLAVAQYGSVSYDATLPYIATAYNDATPTANYNPLFSTRVADTTKTLAAAEAIIHAALTNPDNVE